MLSALSIILVLSIKSMDISAKDYHQLRIMVRAIPPDPYAPQLVPFILENKLDTLVYQLAQAPGVKEMYSGTNNTATIEFQIYEKLRELASEKELNELLYHDSPVVNVYAYRALRTNQMTIDCDVETSLLSDTTCLEWYINENLITTTVGEIIQTPF